MPWFVDGIDGAGVGVEAAARGALGAILAAAAGALGAAALETAAPGTAAAVLANPVLNMG